MAMAVALTDPTILVVNAQLRLLAAAHLPATIDRLLLGLEMPRGAGSSAALYVPPVTGVWHHMMGVRALLAPHILISFRYKAQKVPLL
jgi:hypothetical protein